MTMYFDTFLVIPRSDAVRQKKAVLISASTFFIATYPGQQSVSSVSIAIPKAFSYHSIHMLYGLLSQQVITHFKSNKLLS